MATVSYGVGEVRPGALAEGLADATERLKCALYLLDPVTDASDLPGVAVLRELVAYLTQASRAAQELAKVSNEAATKKADLKSVTSGQLQRLPRRRRSAIRGSVNRATRRLAGKKRG